MDGFAVEQDTAPAQGGIVSFRYCTGSFPNVAQCGGGLDVRSGTVNHVQTCIFSMHDVGGASDVLIESGGEIDEIADCTFDGIVSSGVILDDNGPTVAVAGNSFDYPAGRQRYSGSFV